MKICSSIINIT